MVEVTGMDFIRKSIKRKLIFFSALSLMITSLSIISYSIIKTRANNLQYAKDNALSSATSYSDRLKREFEQNLKIAETYSSALSTVKLLENHSNISRQDIIIETKQIITDNPSILGFYVIFEPNEFDGNDAINIGKLGSDETGRLNTYWARDEKGELVLEAEPDTNLNDPVEGDYYYWAKELKSSRLLEPSFYPIAGKNVFMSAFSAPIITDGKFYGITGLDFSIDYLQKDIKKINIDEGRAKLTLVSNEGLIVATQFSDSLVGKEFAKFCKYYPTMQRILTSGKAFTDIINDTLTIALPVSISKTGTPWIVNIQVPMDYINSAANTLAIKLIVIAMLIGIFGVAINYYFANRISKPIVDLTDIANKVARGDLSKLVTSTSKDEIRKLGDSFNFVIHSISKMQDEILTMHSNIEQGNLSHRAIADELSGTYRQLIDNVNSVVDGIVYPLRESAEYFKQISQGRIPNIIEQNQNGEFDEIKNSLNICIIAINKLIRDTENTFQAAIKGELTHRADASSHQGDFKDIIIGFNSTLDRLVGLIDEMPLAVNIIDADKNIIYRNKKSIEIEG